MSDNVEVPPQQRELRERVQRATVVLKTQGQGIGGFTGGIETVWSCLNDLGIEDEPGGLALLEAETTKEGDARAIFVDQGGAKIARFNAAWAILKGKKTVEEKKEGMLLTDVVSALRPVSQWKDAELLEAYGPDCSSEVAAELNRRANERPFLVFEGDKVNVDESVRLLHVARRRNTPDTTMVDGKVARVCRVGEFPMTWVEECPIHDDVLLVGGYCEKCKNDWSKMKEEDRVYVRVAVVTSGGPQIFTFDKINEVITRGVGQIKSPAVDERLAELTEEDRLPRLRRKLSQARNGKSDPFFTTHREF